MFPFLTPTPSSPPTARAKVRRLLGGLLASIGAATLITAIATVGWFASADFSRIHPLQTCDQPSDIVYEPGAAYHVYRSEIGGWLSDQQSVTVGREPGYGVPVILHPSAAGNVTCSWSAMGVTVTDSVGIAHTVPASVFIGGR